ncbi:MAG: hypothetical protein JWM86_2075 [Thermoleophilia bacterium]|nr:hypothetical protein [Thermoleophilia bacterium]
MQLAPIAPLTALTTSGPSAATADFNVHVQRTSQVDDDGVFTVDSQQVTLVPGNRDGGFVLRSTYFGGGVQTNIRHIQGSDAERAAAQAVRDAIHASGLLAEARPSDRIGRPDVGLTRIYLDRHSSYVEFANDHPTPAAQAVLDAVAAWAKLR